jgi:hypothetical protein
VSTTPAPPAGAARPADLLVLTVTADYQGSMTVAASVDDAALAAWLHEIADKIAAGEHRITCEACAAGVPHDHSDQE